MSQLEDRSPEVLQVSERYRQVWTATKSSSLQTWALNIQHVEPECRWSQIFHALALAMDSAGQGADQVLYYNKVMGLSL